MKTETTIVNRGEWRQGPLFVRLHVELHDICRDLEKPMLEGGLIATPAIIDLLFHLKEASDAASRASNGCVAAGAYERTFLFGDI